MDIALNQMCILFLFVVKITEFMMWKRYGRFLFDLVDRFQADNILRSRNALLNVDDFSHVTTHIEITVIRLSSVTY